MANKQNKKNKKSVGSHRKKMSLGSGHLRRYLYWKIMAFSYRPMNQKSKCLNLVYFIGFLGSLNSNLTTWSCSGHLRVNLYWKKHGIFVSTYTKTSICLWKGGFWGFSGTLNSNLTSKKFYFISVATYTYENRVLVDLSYIKDIFWGFWGRWIRFSPPKKQEKNRKFTRK